MSIRRMILEGPVANRAEPRVLATTPLAKFFSGLYLDVLGNQFDPSVSWQQAALVKKLARLRKGQSALDIPCGQGRLTIPLAKMGLEMTGVDLVSGMVRRAQTAAQRQRMSIRFMQADMRRIEFDGEFDAIFNWFGSFGYFSDEQNLDVVRRFCKALKPGGRLLLEGPNKSWIMTHFRPRHEAEISGVAIATHNRWRERTSRVNSEWTFARGVRKEKKWISVRLYSGAELRALLRAAGLVDIELHGNPPLTRFTRHSHRWIAVARRPK